MLSRSLPPAALNLAAPAALPPGVRIYAVGDPHGHADRLADLHAQIAAHAGRHRVASPLVVYLGDYVDRGPDSAGVLAMLLQPTHGIEAITLLGNHEDLMLAALHPSAPPEDVDLWLANGGDATLASYGASTGDRASWARVPTAHRALLRGCRRSFAAGGYLFAHAGIRPGIALEDQDPHDLIWIREPFLSWPGELPLVVVHGHTPVRAPEVLAHRIGLDTGAGYGGPLTCAVLEADRLGFLVA